MTQSSPEVQPSERAQRSLELLLAQVGEFTVVLDAELVTQIESGSSRAIAKEAPEGTDSTDSTDSEDGGDHLFLDLEDWFGVDNRHHRPRDLQVRTRRGVLSLGVSRVLGIERVPLSALQPLPPLILATLDGDGIIGVLSRNRRQHDQAAPLALVLDPERLLPNPTRKAGSHEQ